MSIFQIVVKAQFNDSDEYRNVHHYDFAFYIPNATELQEAVDALDAAYKTHLQAIYPLDVRVYAYDVRQVDVPSLPIVEFIPTAGAWEGVNTNEALPTQCAALSTFKAQTVFPRTTRTYHFPFSEAANVTGGLLSSNALFLLDLWQDEVLELPITGQLDANKTAVKYDGNPRIVVADNEVVQASAAVRFATQRRRKIGVGI